MSKANRKRKHTSEHEYEIILPKNKFKNFDEAAQAEEEKLSKILFGGSASFLESLEEAEHEERPSCSNVDSGVGETDSEDSNQKEEQPAWVDEDDDGIEVGSALDIQGRKLPKGGVNSRKNQYSNLLKRKFEVVVGTPKWADLNRKRNRDSDSEDEILQTCGFINKTNKDEIGSSSLEYKKVKDLNRDTHSEGHIYCVEFHPTSSVALVAGYSGIASLFAVDGKKNSKLHSVQFEKFPVMCGKFINNGNQAVLGSHNSFVFSYDLLSAKATKVYLPRGITHCKNFTVSPDSKYMAVAGKYGEIHLLESASKERIALLRLDSEATALAFNPNSRLLYGHSDTGEVTIWDMNMRRVKHKWIDEGCIQGTSITISSSNQFVATGSAQGVVNLYNSEEVLTKKTPKARKSILNLVTGITDLKFNHSSEILALSSTAMENSIRMFHLGSLSVYNNFPCFGTKLNHVTKTNFSTGSGYFAIGNRNSTVALYRLKHFQSY